MIHASHLKPRRMVLIILAGFFGTWVLPQHCWSEAKQNSKAALLKAVRQLLEDQQSAWNKGDLDGFMKTYWKSEKLTFFSGKDVTKGWRATLERFRKRYQSEGKTMGKLTFKAIELEVMGPTHAWARGRWQVVRGKETMSGLFTLIIKKMPQGWCIVHDHTSMN